MSNIVTTWVVCASAMLVFMIVLGVFINGQVYGILIDSRAKVSLSQFQLVLWTLLFVSSFLAIAYARKTINIELKPELWALMGISVGSTAGAVIVKGTKSASSPDVSKIGSKLDKRALAVNRRGVLQTNPESSKARFVDMFKGEEITDASYVDISKVQMFLFTIAVWLGYITMLLGEDFVLNGDKPIMFPSLSASMITLIGISHVGYLTVKAAPKTPTKQ